MFNWSKKLREDDLSAPMVEYGAAKIEREERRADLYARFEKALAELRTKREVDHAAFVGPVGKYRIIRKEFASPDVGVDGWYVETWRAVPYGYYPNAGPAGVFYDVYDMSISSFLASYDKGEWKSGHELVWESYGPHNPHKTFEDASEWLRKWLNPEVEEVFFDARGERIAA